MVSKAFLSHSDVDPLAAAIAPPRSETDEQRHARLAEEAEAKRVSDAIDDDIQKQAKAEKRTPKPIKILLLGQSESGKSTTLKNFQLMNTPKAFRAERASWRAVIYLNVVRSIRVILDAIEVAQITHRGPSSPASSMRSGYSPSRIPHVTTEHLKLKLRLAPLVQVEEQLIRTLTTAGSGESEATHIVPTGMGLADRVRAMDKELAVNGQFAWKGMLHRLLPTARESMDSEAMEPNDPDDPGYILRACADDMITLWRDQTVRQLLRAMSIRLEDMPGFFLDSLDRVTSAKYVPTDEDVLRARLKTLGATEHKFTIKDAGLGGSTRNLLIYDVGGQRSLVSAWAPFFDDVNAILFLAPLSGFDQVLAEDETVNRLEDSVLLWKSLCSNPLLGGTSLILFLNKMDIFSAKLRSGIQFGQYIISYGNRPNDYDGTSSYMRRKFGQIHKEYSPQPRTFYSHFTSVTDTQSTAKVLTDVQDSIIMSNLRSLRMTG